MNKTFVKTFRIVLVFALLSGYLVSCGDHGRGGSLPRVPLKTSDVRIQQPNDSWWYSMTGAYVYYGMTYDLWGSENRIIATTTRTSPSAVVCNIEYTSMAYTLGGYSYLDDSWLYYTQDASGTVYAHGAGDESGGDKWIIFPDSGFIKHIPSPMFVGDSGTDTVMYSNGDTATYSYNVTGTEYIFTGIAEYESYKASIFRTAHYVSGPYERVETTGTAWIVPGIGTVKTQTNQYCYVGGVLILVTNLTETLTSTNILY